LKDFSFEKVLNDDIYLVKNNLNAKKGVINLKGELIIKSKYNEIEQVKSFFIAKINNKKGFISLTDSIIKPFDYDKIYFSYFTTSFVLRDYKVGDNFIMQKDNLYGVINPYIVNDIIPLRYKNIITLFDKYYIVQNAEDKSGLLLENGVMVLKEEYKFYNNYENKIFATKKTNKS
ncbi:hypothetical protein ACLH3U_001787, partial [Flavobacterium psychrophilum]